WPSATPSDAGRGPRWSADHPIAAHTALPGREGGLPATRAMDRSADHCGPLVRQPLDHSLPFGGFPLTERAGGKGVADGEIGKWWPGSNQGNTRARATRRRNLLGPEEIGQNWPPGSQPKVLPKTGSF